MSEKTVRRNKRDGKDDEKKKQERAEERALFEQYRADPSNAREEALVEKYRALVYRIVHRFRFSPDQFEDLVQVGTYGLVLAIRRFDPSKAFRFSTYAWTTIQGEIQRYFRDKTWAINVPRDLKERSLKVFNAANEIAKMSGHAPNAAEVARETGLTEEAVQEAMELGSAYHPQSFTDNIRESEVSFALAEDSSGSGSLDMAATKQRVFWDSVLSYVSETEARVVKLYFFEQRTQKEIAERMGTSQMNVSRILRIALGKLRTLIVPEDVEDIGAL